MKTSTSRHANRHGSRHAVGDAEKHERETGNRARKITLSHRSLNSHRSLLTAPTPPRTSPPDGASHRSRYASPGRSPRSRSSGSGSGGSGTPVLQGGVLNRGMDSMHRPWMHVVRKRAQRARTRARARMRTCMIRCWMQPDEEVLLSASEIRADVQADESDPGAALLSPE